MSVTIDGTGTVTGLSTGGLPDGSIAAADLATDAVTGAKIIANAVDETKLKDALVADFTEVVVTASDSILLGDATDSGNTKRDTVQGIIDLAGVAGITSSANATAISIDANEIVTMPSQPAFGVSGANFSGTEFLGTTTRSNIGNHFSTTNGRFTAPVAGTYSFTYVLSTNDTNSQMVLLKKNGVSLGQALIYAIVFNTGSITINILLAAGDYVQGSKRNSAYSVYDSWFSGYLIG